MKINEITSVLGNYSQSRIQKNPAQKAPAMGTDSIELSSFAGVYSEAVAAARRDAQAQDAAYAQRLQEVSARFQSGAYSVSAMDVGRKILGLA